MPATDMAASVDQLADALMRSVLVRLVRFTSRRHTWQRSGEPCARRSREDSRAASALRPGPVLFAQPALAQQPLPVQPPLSIQQALPVQLPLPVQLLLSIQQAWPVRQLSPVQQRFLLAWLAVDHSEQSERMGLRRKP